MLARSVSSQTIQSRTTQRVVEDLADAVVSILLLHLANNMRRVKLVLPKWRRRQVSMLGSVCLGEALAKIDLAGHPKADILLSKLSTVTVRAKWRRSDILATYSRPKADRNAEVVIYVKPATMDAFAACFERGEMDDFDVSRSKMPGIRSTLVHELTHACDDALSAGRFENNVQANKRRATGTLHGPAFTKHYKRDPSEINAYTAEALACSTGLASRISLIEYVDFVLVYLDGTIIMGGRQRRAVIRRAAKYWASQPRDENILDIDEGIVAAVSP